jgi:hypothetical protein
MTVISVIITPTNLKEFITNTINPHIIKADNAVKNQPPITLTTPDTL